MIRSKYGSKKTIYKEIKFDSLAERDYYILLEGMLSRKEIMNIELQPKVYLTKAKILYKPDFLITDSDNKKYYIDVKGFKTPVFNIKARLWKAYIEDELHIIKKKGRGFITEKIING
tara:strand:+ start:7414 stop:7764 length:351 start_codon:yes stop_codon:yes gene_type:complete